MGIDDADSCFQTRACGVFRFEKGLAGKGRAEGEMDSCFPLTRFEVDAVRSFAHDPFVRVCHAAPFVNRPGVVLWVLRHLVSPAETVSG
jgi:hypothetical protein